MARTPVSRAAGPDPAAAARTSHDRFGHRTALRPRADRRRDADRAPHRVLQSSPQADSRLVETPSSTPAASPAPRLLKATPVLAAPPEGSSAARGSPAP